MFCSPYSTGHGTGVVYASDKGVVRVEIPNISHHVLPGHEPDPEYEPSAVTIRAAQLLEHYFHGERVDFSALSVDISTMPPFRQKVLCAIRALAYGVITTYGQVAACCESPRASRAVGGGLASNPIPIIIPCHRVVAANGQLTGFSAPGGTATKRALLLMEGIEFKGELVVINQLVMHKVP